LAAKLPVHSSIPGQQEPLAAQKQSQSNNNCQPDITMQHDDIRL